MPDKCATHSYLADLIEGTLKGRGEDMPWAVGGLTVAEWRQLVAAIRGRASPSSLSFSVGTLRAAVIEECAKAAESYNWVDDERVQGPDEHQKALTRAIRGLGATANMPPSGPSGGITVPSEPTVEMWIAGNKKLPATPVEDETDYTMAIWKAMLEASPYATDGGHK